MLKNAIILFAIIIVIKIGINISDVLYLRFTLYLLENGFDMTTRAIHTRRLCARAGINCGIYFDDPMFNNRELKGIVRMAIGEYKHRAMESLNPFYWIRLILFLPQNIIAYFGCGYNTFLAKILNFIYWIIGIAVALYPNEIRHYLEAFFK